MTDPGGGAGGPVEWLFLGRETPTGAAARWLGSALAHCAWNCHVVLAGGDPDGSLLESVVGHLEDEPVAMVHLHLVADGSFGDAPSVERLMTAAERFQAEAYRERTGSRLLALPILEVPAGADPRPALRQAAALAARLAKPSLLLREPPPRPVVEASSQLGLRLYLDADPDPLNVLTRAHIFDAALTRLERAEPLLAPCHAHEVVDGGRVFGCARLRSRGEVRARIDRGVAPAWHPDPGLCARCLAETIGDTAPALDVNLRRAEGRELALRTSAALVDAGLAGPAASVARTAVALSDDPGERADALIQTALCLLADHRLDDADRALVGAGEAGAPAGAVAYHRARVQVAWRDDIEALDRFAEALEIGTDAVGVDDLHLEMALSHIRLEEWADARAHLEQVGGDDPVVAFNLGVCDVNDGRAERALDHLDRALELGPAAEDLGRVRFFRGFCLKQLERFAEAIDDLRLAIDLERPEPAHHNLLGFCLFKLGRHTEAVASFSAAVALDPASAVDWANLGVNHERLGDTDRAREMYCRALSIDQSIAFAREGLERVNAPDRDADVD